jgi:hypothetical protein
VLLYRSFIVLKYYVLLVTYEYANVTKWLQRPQHRQRT